MSFSPLRWTYRRAPEVHFAEKPVITDILGDGILAKLEALRLVSRQHHRGLHSGERDSRELGQGLEFADRRPYTPGDDIRSVDWTVLARFDEAHVRLHQRDADVPVRIAIDTSASMSLAGTTKLQLAAQVGAALAYIGLSGQDRVSIAAFSDGEVQMLPLLRGKAQIFAILDFLRNASRGRATDLLASCTQLANRSERPGTTIILSDFYDFEGAAAGLAHLRYRKHEVMALQVIDEAQAHPSSQPARGAVNIVDCERGVDLARAWLNDDLMQEYARAHEAYCQDFARSCKQGKMTYVRLSTQLSLERAVLRALRCEGVLR
jgi:uncharacterized protein (DUF58 family)